MGMDVLNDPVNLSDVREMLRGKILLVCPDTNVLLQMVKRVEHTPTIIQASNWVEQMKHCEELLGLGNVGWVAPYQVKKEYEEIIGRGRNGTEGWIKKGEQAWSTLTDFAGMHIGQERISDSGMRDLHDRMATGIDSLTRQAKQLQKEICEKIVIFREAPEPVQNAWMRVRESEFPNRDRQEMKDSVILDHLLLCKERFREFLHDGGGSFGEGNACQLYFWTFDHLGDDKVRRFPDKVQTLDNDADIYINIVRNITRIPLPNLSLPEMRIPS